MDTMEEGPNDALYRLDPDFSLHKLDDGIVVSNSPYWSPEAVSSISRILGLAKSERAA
jgi:sugar lactone lactonase YvrE